MYLVRGSQHQSRHIWLRRDKVHCRAVKGKVHVRTGHGALLTSGQWRVASGGLQACNQTSLVPQLLKRELSLTGLPHLQALEAESHRGWMQRQVLCCLWKPEAGDCFRTCCENRTTSLWWPDFVTAGSLVAAGGWSLKQTGGLRGTTEVPPELQDTCRTLL